MLDDVIVCPAYGNVSVVSGWYVDVVEVPVVLIYSCFNRVEVYVNSGYVSVEEGCYVEVEWVPVVVSVTDFYSFGVSV